MVNTLLPILALITRRRRGCNGIDLDLGEFLQLIVAVETEILFSQVSVAV